MLSILSECCDNKSVENDKHAMMMTGVERDTPNSDREIKGRIELYFFIRLS